VIITIIATAFGSAAISPMTKSLPTPSDLIIVGAHSV
jgi:hypothetical protein